MQNNSNVVSFAAFIKCIMLTSRPGPKASFSDMTFYC